MTKDITDLKIKDAIQDEKINNLQTDVSEIKSDVKEIKKLIEENNKVTNSRVFQILKIFIVALVSGTLVGGIIKASETNPVDKVKTKTNISKNISK